jgi:phospholipid-translocating ATPase
MAFLFKEAETRREVFSNDKKANKAFHYNNNVIKTNKYNIITFLPLNLFEQFKRTANIYFAVLLAMQLLPLNISPLSPSTTFIPLVFVLAVTAIKDAFDDLKRSQNDRKVNNRKARLVYNDSVHDTKWSNVKVGDIVRLDNNDFVTADMLLLSSSESNGFCYIETAELDGETNLKMKQALLATSSFDEPASLSTLQAKIECEPPNNKLGEFVGHLKINLEDKVTSLTMDNSRILLRGCTLRNTAYAYGLVIFAGRDTKLMMNTGKSKFKRTSIDILLNKLVIVIFIFLLFLCLIASIGSYVWDQHFADSFNEYLPNYRLTSDGTEISRKSIFTAILSFLSYIILMNTVVPISLYVTVELIRVGLSKFIDWDSRMVFEGRGAKARTTTLNEELGQVQYVFSDKTGTLTQNKMVFRKCSIANVDYGRGGPEDSEDSIPDPTEARGTPLPTIDEGRKGFCDMPDHKFRNPDSLNTGFRWYDESLLEQLEEGNHDAEEFFRLLALCHTVMPEGELDEATGELVPETLKYQAQSPDEQALLTAAREFGFTFVARDPDTIIIAERDEFATYCLLSILDFNNVRKRMSVIVRPRGEDGQPDESKPITLYCKGADNVIFERLAAGQQATMDTTQQHLQNYAETGLRTLVLAKRDVSKEEYEDWNDRMEKAVDAVNRGDVEDALYEEIEKDLRLLGATAIEDKLQDGVPECIAALRQALINIWVLTGDKTETAINIGYSCNLIDGEMELEILEGNTTSEVLQRLMDLNEKMSGELEGQPSLENKQFCLVISGSTLTHAMDPVCMANLVEVATNCRTVICTRVTPLQKALVVEMIRKALGVITLSIGDGANDVSMIKAAHIGIGIEGQEGLQAVMSSDFSLAQFRFLQRLLLVHGHWSYHRMCYFLRYFFYKNFAFSIVQFWFAFFNGFSAASVFDQNFIAAYNLAYTSWTVIGLGVFDKDVEGEMCQRYPKIYIPGQQNLLFNKFVFFQSVVHGIWHSIVLYFATLGLYSDYTSPDGLDFSDYQSFAFAVASNLVLVVTLQIALDTRNWTALNHFFIWASLLVFFAFQFIICSTFAFKLLPSTFPFVGVAVRVWGSVGYWLTAVLCVALCLLPVIALRVVELDLKPSYMDIIRSQVKRKQKQLEKSVPKKKKKVVPNLKRRNTGYAFSHQEGFGALIKEGKYLHNRQDFNSSRVLSVRRVSMTPSQHAVNMQIIPED